jgi:hypothetical protein
MADDVTADELGDKAVNQGWSSDVVISDPTHDPKYSGRKAGLISSRTRSQVKLYEVWVKEVGLLYDESDKPDWQTIYDTYPYGRVIIMTKTVILMDAPNVFNDGKLPYVKFDNVERPDMFWGKSEIEPIEPLQKELNKRSSQIMESANMTADPKILVPRSAQLKKGDITTRPGERIPYSGNQEPKYMMPPSMPPYASENLDRTMNYVETIGGNYGILGGTVGSAATSAAAIQTIQEMAQQRPRMKMQNLSDCLCEMGELIISRIKQHYDKPRQMAITVGDGENGILFDTIESSDITDHYNIDIGVGSNLPTSQATIFQMLMTLHELGAILDPADILEAIDFPKRDVIVKHNKAIQAENQQNQMQQAQAGGQPQPGQPGAGAPPQLGQPAPAGPFSMRPGGGAAGGPPPPPPHIPPQAASLVSQILEAAHQGEGMPPEMAAILGAQGMGQGQPPGQEPPAAQMPTAQLRGERGQG